MADQVVKKFSYAKITESCKLPLIAVYKQPLDYPKKYVARLWNGKEHTHFIALADTFEEIQEAIPKEMLFLPPDKKDDPILVGTWI